MCHLVSCCGKILTFGRRGPSHGDPLIIREKYFWSLNEKAVQVGGGLFYLSHRENFNIPI